MQTEFSGELVYYHYPGGPVFDPFVTPRPAQQNCEAFNLLQVSEQTVMPVATCISTVQTGT